MVANNLTNQFEVTLGGLHMKIGKLLILITLCGMLLVSSSLVNAADEEKTITDPEDDVITYDEDTGEEITTSEHPNIDIVMITYSKTGKIATIVLTVNDRGEIENRGNLSTETGFFDSVTYTISLSTSDNVYEIIYINNTCTLSSDLDTVVNLTEDNFTVNGPILTITFDLKNAEETYDYLAAYTAEINFVNNEFFIDTATDEPLEITIQEPFEEEGIVGEPIEFYGEPTGGVFPYTLHWDFGDGNTSDDEFPIHTYTQVGTYTVTVTVTDSADETATSSMTLTIGSSGPVNGGEDEDTDDSNILIFGLVIVVIAVIGVIAIIIIIRR
jgi:PKD repeat protein